MTFIAIIVGVSDIKLLFAVVPESLTLLVFGVTLIGATAGLRRVFRRHDKNILKREEDLKG
jgi:hypothetical protein